MCLQCLLSVTAWRTLPVNLTSPQKPVSVEGATDAFYIQLLCLILKGAGDFHSNIPIPC